MFKGKDNLDLMDEALNGDTFPGSESDRALVHVLRALRRREIAGAGHVLPELARAIIDANVMDTILASEASLPQMIVVEDGVARGASGAQMVGGFAFTIGGRFIRDAIAARE